MANLYWSFLNFIVRLYEAIFKKSSSSTVILNQVDFSSPEDLMEKLQYRDIQIALADWVQNTLRSLEDNDAYLAAAKGSKLDRFFNLDTATIAKILRIMEPFVLLGTPAHDLGHHLFDGFGGSAIIGHDPFIAKGYRNDINGAFFGAMFHDSSTGIQHRYIDNEWECNHGELAAAIFFFNTAGILPLNTRLLAAYAIAAHPHMLKEMTAKNGSVRKPWVDELFYDGQKPVRLAVWITRWTDRLENGGDPATHLPRHALASVDGARVGGLDLHGINWYGFNDGLKFLFVPKAVVTEVPVLDKDGQPVLKDGQPAINKIPSMLMHLQGYAKSALAFPYSPYNQNDHLSPSMQMLMAFKVKSSAELIDTVTNTVGEPDFEKFVTLMKIKSGDPLSPTGLETIEMVRELWELNSKEDQAHWANGFEMALDTYYTWVAMLQKEISEATDPTVKAFAPLICRNIAKIL